MKFIKSIFISALFCEVVISVIGANNVFSATGAKVSKDEGQKLRFIDFDGLITSALGGMDAKVNNYVTHSSSTSSSSSSSTVVKKVTHGTAGGQTITKTEITHVSDNFPQGFRFKRDLQDDLMDKIKTKAEIVKQKLAGAVADGVNLGYSGINKVEKVIQGMNN